MNFGIGIPTYNRWDLLEETLGKYIIDFPYVDIHVYDNGNQNIPNSINGRKIYVHSCGKNIGVAASWNYLIDRIFEKSDFALILNDDVYLGKQEAHIRLLLEQKFDFAVTPLDWCAYIIPKKTYVKVGKFDENFYPAYCEDCDYHLRMKKKGLALFKTPFLIPKVYRASMTMEKDPQGFYKANHNSLQYFKKKWGKYPEELL
jgi:GT2 family glycosyltransferase